MTSKEFRIVMTSGTIAFALLFAFITLIAVRTGALTPPAAQAASYTLSPTYYYTATVPGLLSYQGTLADGNGNPIDGNVEMTFRIYTTTLGGTPLYTETHPAVVVRRGDFAVLLGDLAPFPAGLFAEPDRYLGLQVAAQPEMAPRQRFASVAFAMEAGHALSATQSITATYATYSTRSTGAGDSNNTLTTKDYVDSRWPDGSYCILRAGGSCPSGFASGYICLDTEDNNNKDSVGGSIGASHINASCAGTSPGRVRLEFCCK